MLVQSVLLCAAVLLLVPVSVLFVEVMAGIMPPARDATRPASGERPPLAVLMPAHNEAYGIAGAIRSILQQLRKDDRLIVVADNCSDDTARIAAAEGAEVIERHDAFRRGKGYALDFGVRYLEGSPPPVVIVVDADCRVADGSLDTLARVCAGRQRPVQALYLMHADASAGPKTRIAKFAWVVKNRIRPQGLDRLGLPCQLMGTGMAFPWSRIVHAELASGHIVEDLKLGVDLARTGSPPLFCAEALVTSDFPSSAEGARTQRARWEHGYLSVILSEAPRALFESLRSGKGDLFALALDLCVPPLALLTLLVTAGWLVSIGVLLLWKTPYLAGAMTVELMLLGLAVLASWLRHGRQIISLGGLGMAVMYAASKIPLYAKFLVARQASWIRSKRGPD